MGGLLSPSDHHQLTGLLVFRSSALKLAPSSRRGEPRAPPGLLYLHLQSSRSPRVHSQCPAMPPERTFSLVSPRPWLWYLWRTLKQSQMVQAPGLSHLSSCNTWLCGLLSEALHPGVTYRDRNNGNWLKARLFYEWKRMSDFTKWFYSLTETNSFILTFNDLLSSNEFARNCWELHSDTLKKGDRLLNLGLLQPFTFSGFRHFTQIIRERELREVKLNKTLEGRSLT